MLGGAGDRFGRHFAFANPAQRRFFFSSPHPLPETFSCRFFLKHLDVRERVQNPAVDGSLVCSQSGRPTRIGDLDRFRATG